MDEQKKQKALEQLKEQYGQKGRDFIAAVVTVDEQEKLVAFQKAKPEVWERFQQQYADLELKKSKGKNVSKAEKAIVYHVLKNCIIEDESIEGLVTADEYFTQVDKAGLNVSADLFEALTDLSQAAVNFL